MKPILFNTEMVQAILAGRKTATRRVVKPQLPKNTVRINEVDPIGYMSFQTTDRLLDGWGNRRAPYQLGDILYVRETAMIQSMKNYEKAVKLYFKADDKLEQFGVSNEFYEKLLQYPENKWLSPYWLTREAARIFLRVTSVRVERLQEITPNDIDREGTPFGLTFAPYDGFSRIWNTTIKPADLPTYGWEANPWVWVIEFERCEKPGEEAE